MDDGKAVTDPIISALLRARKSKGLRQQDVADSAGISRRALVSIEAGKDCTLATLRALAAALDVKIEAKMSPAVSTTGSSSRRGHPTLEAMNASQQQRELAEALRVRAMNPKQRSQWLSSTWGPLQQQAMSIHRNLHADNLRVRHFATPDDKNRYDEEQESAGALRLALSRGRS